MHEKLKGISWIAISQITLIVSSFLLLKLLTSELSVESYGIYSLTLMIALFIRQVLYDPISIVVGKHCAANATSSVGIQKGIAQVRYLTLRIAALLSIIAAAIALTLTGFSFDSEIAFAAFFCCIYLFSNGAQGIYLNVLNLVGSRKTASLFSSLDSILKYLVMWLTLSYMTSNYTNALASLAISTLVVYIFVTVMTWSATEKAAYSRDEVSVTTKINLIQSIPLLAPALMTAFKSVSDRWFLTAFVGVEELAAFSVLLQLGFFPMILIIGVVQTYVGPYIYKIISKRNYKTLSNLKQYLANILVKISIFSSICVATAYAFADLTFSLVVGSEYQKFSQYLYIFVITGCIAATTGIIHVAIISLCNTRVVAKLMLTSVVFGASVSVILTIKFAFLGAIAGMLFANVFSLVFYGFALSKEFHQHE